MKELLVVLMLLLSPVPCFALGGESYFEYRDGDAINKFTTYIEFNHVIKEIKFYGSYRVDSLDYVNGTFIPEESKYTIGFNVPVSKELAVEVKHVWEHRMFPYMDQGNYNSFKLKYTW